MASAELSFADKGQENNSLKNFTDFVDTLCTQTYKKASTIYFFSVIISSTRNWVRCYC